MSRCHTTGSRIAVAAIAALAMLLAAGLGSRPAAAQSTAFDVQQFRPNPHTLGGFAVDSARVLPHLRWTGSVIFNYADDPLRLVRGDTNETVLKFVTAQATMNVMFAIGLFDFLDISVDMPTTVSLGSDGLEPTPTGPVNLDALPDSGFGDIRITPRVEFLDGLFGLGVAVDVWLPTGNSDAFLSDDNVRVQPRIAMHLDFDVLMVLMNVGLSFAQDTTFYDLTTGHELRWGLGVVAPFQFNDDDERPHALDVIGEMTSYAALDDPYGPANTAGLEARLGVRWRTPIGVSLHAAAGPGFLPGYGDPDWRAIIGVQYTSLPPKPDCPDCPPCEEPRECDKDRDRVCDPWVAEEDAWDRCGDVCKRSDECPDVPEDYDGFRDLDGCPEPDNDCDRICDPWVDNEHVDQMAHFRQYDGCGASDGTCPAHATDGDAPCPASDERPYCRVREGTTDILHDVCPDRPETYNQNEDDDGCPDCTTFIPFTGRIEFEHAKWKMEDLTPESQRILDDIVRRLKEPRYSHIKKIRVEGHTSDVWNGKAWWGFDENIDLSNKRARSTMEYLQAHDVPVEVEFKGYGWTRTPPPPAGLEDGGRKGDVIKGDPVVEEWRDRSRRTVFRVIEWESQEGCEHPCEKCDELRDTGDPADALPPGRLGPAGAR